MLEVKDPLDLIFPITVILFLFTSVFKNIQCLKI